MLPLPASERLCGSNGEPEAYSDCLAIDFGDCSRDDFFAAYHDLGVLCFGAAPRRLLLKAAGEDADSHYALRDVLRTVARVGSPGALDMSIAVVTRSAAITHVAHSMRADLALLGCRLRVFSSMDNAHRWLAGRLPPPLTSFINLPRIVRTPG